MQLTDSKLSVFSSARGTSLS